jgi:hypothetical protein
MLTSGSIQKIGTTRPDLYAFRISGEITRDDMNDMATHMNDVFDKQEEVDMLLYFKDFEGSEAGSGLSVEALRSQFRALNSVRRYVVANAPESAGQMVEAMGKLLPVDAESFDDMDAALDSLDAKRITTA